MHSSKENKLAAVFICLVLIIVIAGLIYNYWNYQYRMVLASERERLTVVSNYLDIYLDSRVSGLKLLAGNQNIRKLNSEWARRDLKTAIDVLGFSNVQVYDLEGKLLVNLCNVSGHSDQPRININANGFKQAAQGQSVVSDRVVLGGVDKAFVSIWVPVMGANEKVTGVLAGYVPLTNIASYIGRERLAEGQHVVLIDGESQLIYHPRMAAIYPNESLYKERLRNLFNGKAGEVVHKSFLDGVDKVYIYYELFHNWKLAMAIPLSAVYERVIIKSFEDAGSFFFMGICLMLLYGAWRQARMHEQEREQLKYERMASVNQLAAGIAHEVRNPLTSIKGFIQLMAKRGNRPPNEEHLEIILGEIGRIDRLISEFQMLAKPLQEPVFERVDICKLLSDIAVLMEGQIHSKSINLKIKLPSGSCAAVGDISQLKQVFINLLKNAVEAVPLHGEIVASVGSQQGMLAVSIEDNGRGIPQEILEKIGTPFLTTKETGTGLGLSVCYNIIEHHRGALKVNTYKDKGTVFTVLLPVPADEQLIFNV